MEADGPYIYHLKDWSKFSFDLLDVTQSFYSHDLDVINKYPDDWPIDSWWGDKDAVVFVHLLEDQFLK